jgi:signal transduction histidine kinase
VLQIGELIDDVLFLSELETGKEVVALGSTPVQPVLSRLAAELAERAARADLELRFEAEPGLELPLRPRMLRIVVENLAENALRYAGPRARFSIDVGQAPEGIVLRAADDGAGVAEDDLARLFERFYRADRARSSRGTGLGLAIVKHLVQAHGGDLEIESTVGRGTVVRVVFPARPGPRARDPLRVPLVDG